MTQTEKDSNTLQDMFKPRRNPERINWDRSRDLAGEQSILWACAGCTGRPSYWGSDEETVWQSCQRCGHEKVTNSPHCDHVIPQSKGGDKSPENLVTACPHCNCSKCDHTPEEWQRRAS